MMALLQSALGKHTDEQFQSKNADSLWHLKATTVSKHIFRHAKKTVFEQLTNERNPKNAGRII